MPAVMPEIIYLFLSGSEGLLVSSRLELSSLSAAQYSSASMIVITRWVIVGSAGSSEW